MLGVGVLFIIFGRIAQSKVKVLVQRKISFATVDRNHDGKIDIEELQAAATEVGLQLNRAELYLAFALLDTNGDGVVSVEEFEYFFNNTKVARI